MSGHNDPGPGSAPEQPSRMSRRSVLRGAAGAGAVGLAAATGAGAVVAATRPAAKAAEPAALPSHHEPVVVYLRDARTGELDVFNGTSQVRLHDRALAARLLRAVQ
jgi:hypothetical protein